MRWRSVLVGGGAVPPGPEQRTGDLLSSWATNRELAAYADAKPLNERSLGRSSEKVLGPGASRYNSRSPKLARLSPAAGLIRNMNASAASVESAHRCLFRVRCVILHG